MHMEVEGAHQSIRRARQKGMDAIKKAFKGASEDDRKFAEKEVSLFSHSSTSIFAWAVACGCLCAARCVLEATLGGLAPQWELPRLVCWLLPPR